MIPVEPRRAHQCWVDALVEAGALEAALVDAHCTERDGVDAYTVALRALTERIAEGVLDSWHGRARRSDRARGALDAVATFPHPARVAMRVPEGFAYYGLYPETYADAASRFHDEWHPERVLVIGVRSIGTALSAIVAAALRMRGVDVVSLTVRPRGHPFARELRVDRTIEAVAREGSRAGAHFVIADEGPGLSGSSFASVWTMLVSLGAPVERVALLPSWDPAPAALRCEEARRRWPEFHRYVGSFDDLWLRSGRLTSPYGGGVVRELSGGRWRTTVYTNESAYPAVQPQHEQRKLLLERERAGAPPLLLRFVGLGRLGAPRAELASRLARAGFTSPPAGFGDGFLAYPFAPGRPLRAADATPALLRHAARYVAHRARTERVSGDRSAGALLHAVRVNVTEELGRDGRRALRAVERWRPALEAAVPIRVDGRMMPHEWLATDDGWLKTDALFHHDDHFLPGCQDAAWDVAGMIEEWDLDTEARATFVTAYRERSGDATIEDRLPVWRVAYLATRLGYTSLAAEALGDDPDGARMRRLSERHAARLRRALSDLEPLAPWRRG